MMNLKRDTGKTIVDKNKIRIHDSDKFINLEDKYNYLRNFLRWEIIESKLKEIRLYIHSPFYITSEEDFVICRECNSKFCILFFNKEIFDIHSREHMKVSMYLAKAYDLTYNTRLMDTGDQIILNRIRRITNELH